jgi:hypothetical protein
MWLCAQFHRSLTVAALPGRALQGIILVIKSVVAIVAVAIIGLWTSDLSLPMKPRLGIVAARR